MTRPEAVMKGVKDTVRGVKDAVWGGFWRIWEIEDELRSGVRAVGEERSVDKDRSEEILSQIEWDFFWAMVKFTPIVFARYAPLAVAGLVCLVVEDLEVNHKLTIISAGSLVGYLAIILGTGVAVSLQKDNFAKSRKMLSEYWNDNAN